MNRNELRRIAREQLHNSIRELIYTRYNGQFYVKNIDEAISNSYLSTLFLNNCPSVYIFLNDAKKSLYINEFTIYCKLFDIYLNFTVDTYNKFVDYIANNRHIQDITYLNLQYIFYNDTPQYMQVICEYGIQCRIKQYLIDNYRNRFLTMIKYDSYCVFIIDKIVYNLSEWYNETQEICKKLHPSISNLVIEKYNWGSDSMDFVLRTMSNTHSIVYIDNLPTIIDREPLMHPIININNLTDFKKIAADWCIQNPPNYTTSTFDKYYSNYIFNTDYECDERNIISQQLFEHVCKSILGLGDDIIKVENGKSVKYIGKLIK